MTKTKRNGLIILAAVFLLGAVLATVGYMTGGMNSLSIGKGGIHAIKEKDLKLVSVYEHFESFKNINIDTDTVSEINIVYGDDYSVTGQIPARFGSVDAYLDGDTLTIKNENKDSFFGINLAGIGITYASQKSKITITYPRGSELGNVNIDSDVGDVNIDGIAAKTVSVNSSMGDTSIKNAAVDDLTADLNAGDIKMNDIQSGKSDIKIDMGDIKLTKFNAGGLSLTSNMGSTDISGKLTGDANISSKMGDVKLELDQNKDETSYEIECDMGDVKVNGKKTSGHKSKNAANEKSRIHINNNMGDVKLKFAA